MATETRQHSVNFALNANGTLIGGGRGTLRRTVEIGVPIPQTEDLFRRQQSLKRDWMLDITEGQYLEGAGTPTWIKGSTMSLTAGGTAIKGIQLVTFSYGADNPDVTDLEDALDTARLPGERFGTITVSGNWYDLASANGAGLSNVHDGAQASTDVAFVLTFGAAQSFTFTGAISSFDGPMKGGNNAAQFSFSAAISGVVTVVDTNVDSGLGIMFDSIHHATQPQSITVLITNSTVGDTEFLGAAYPSNLTIRIPTAVNALITYTGQLVAASGAYTEQVQT